MFYDGAKLWLCGYCFKILSLCFFHIKKNDNTLVDDHLSRCPLWPSNWVQWEESRKRTVSLHQDFMSPIGVGKVRPAQSSRWPFPHCCLGSWPWTCVVTKVKVSKKMQTFRGDLKKKYYENENVCLLFAKRQLGSRYQPHWVTSSALWWQGEASWPSWWETGS